MNAGADLSDVPEDLILRRMARHLRARAMHPVGSALWACAVLGYDECKREMNRRLIEHVVKAAKKNSDASGLPDADL